MEIQNALKKVFSQLAKVIEQIEDSQFVQPVKSLNGSTIGQHSRHTIEFFTCLMDGYESGKVNYDSRSHDTEIERSKILALEMISRINKFSNNLPQDRKFELEVNYDPESNKNDIVPSSYYRELVYNIEHAIHHMALIKVGIKEVCPEVEIPFDFGVAVSTVKYKKQQSAR